jgi:hypothetical protein
MGKVGGGGGRDNPKNDAPNSIAGLVLGLVLGKCLQPVTLPDTNMAD